MAPLEKLTVLLTLIRRLVSLMDQEVAVLKTMNLESLAEIQEEKAALSEAYALEMDFLRRNPEVLGQLDIDHREILEEETRELQRASRDNAAALQAASEVIDRLMKRLSESLLSAQPAPMAYGHPSSHRGEVISVAFDRQL